MNKENIEKIVKDFANSGEEIYENDFIINSNSEILFKVKIEKKRRGTLDSIATESFISALPSGNTCPNCKGSGKI